MLRFTITKRIALLNQPDRANRMIVDSQSHRYLLFRDVAAPPFEEARFMLLVASISAERKGFAPHLSQRALSLINGNIWPEKFIASGVAEA